jgi:hypothetical protein
VVGINALDGIAAIGATLGQLMALAGQRDDGLEVLRRSEAGFRQLKLTAQANKVADVIRTIEGGEEST